MLSRQGRRFGEGVSGATYEGVETCYKSERVEGLFNLGRDGEADERGGEE